MQKKILIISRLSTQNAGNEALSKILLDYFRNSVPEGLVFALDRYPRQFEKLRLAQLGADPVAAFDALAWRMISRYSRADAPLPQLADRNMVKLDQSAKELRGALRTLKRKLALRRRLASLGLIERDAPFVAVSACTHSDLVVWNPAGEIHPTGSPDQVMRLLLLLRAAQLSGKRTAVINHSLEVNNDALRKLIAHVYGQLDYVGVRDAKSVSVAKSFGVPPERIYEAPDLVFLASQEPPAPEQDGKESGAIGLAINGLESLSGADEWQTLLAGLQRLQRPILLVSNAVNHDLAFASRLADGYPKAVVIEHQPGYEALRGYFKQCSVLISSRLHSSILSLCEGTPVISIEPSVFKLTAIFEQMAYPIATESLQKPGWAVRVLEQVEKCVSGAGGDISSLGLQKVREQSLRVQQAYAPLFRLVEAEPR